MIISASKERADNMSIFLQKLIIETPWLNHLKPKSEEARWSRISFDVNCSPHQAPSVKSVGITGQLTGSRADLMILDDIEVPGNSMTEMMREKLLQLCTEAESILTPKDDSRIMYLRTPQTTLLFIVSWLSVTTVHLSGPQDTLEKTNSVSMKDS